MTQALILVGGQGTRLRPLTCHTPKSMVPVLNMPFLEHVIRNLRTHGVIDIIFAQHHLPQPMLAYFGDGRKLGVKITYVMEDTPRGTAGAVKNAEQHLHGTFFVLNGDVFQNRDFTDMLAFHRRHAAKATICLTPVEDPTAYGLVETGPDGRVRRFLEKPKREDVTTNMINAGTYVLEEDVLTRIPPGIKSSVERELFPGMLADGLPIYGYPSSAYWMDTGTPEKYLQLHRDLLAGRCEGYTFERDVMIGKGTSIGHEAHVSGKIVIGEDCTVAPGASLTGPLVLGQKCHIQEGAVVRDSVLWEGVTIGTRARVDGNVIADGCAVGEGAVLQDAVLGDHITVPAGTLVERGARLYPAGEKP